MLIATATVIHRVFTFDKSLSTTIVAGSTITAFMAVFIAWHCITDEIVMHSVLFGALPPTQSLHGQIRLNAAAEFGMAY
jgi:dihydroceramidase